MNSMTGYGYEELVEEKLFLSVEIKSYNSRFLDLSINLPSSLSRLENFFREKVTAAVVRGKVDVYIRLREEEPATSVLVNQEAVRSYAAAISQVSQILSEMEGTADTPAASTAQSPLELILSQEGVLVSTVNSILIPIRPCWSLFLIRLWSNLWQTEGGRGRISRLTYRKS